MPAFKLYLLGAPFLEVAGEPLALDTRKAIALLAYVVMTTSGGGGQTHTRDALATLLWPELDQSRARAALRRTLSPLRQAVDRRILNVTRETIGLHNAMPPGDNLWVDAIAFRELLQTAAAHQHGDEPLCPACHAALEQAVALYRDDFMSGFSLRDAPQFDDWQYLESEQLRRALATALEQLTRHNALLGAYDRAIELARRRLALDPLSEAVHRALMELYAWSGQRSMAVRQYRDCVRLLEQELGVPPLPETTALYERILAGDVQSQPTSAPATTAAQGAAEPALAQPAQRSLPFVGREAALAQMQAAYAAAQQRGGLLAVVGEPGIGKSRLVAEFLQQAAGHTIHARCYDGEHNLAYAPFIDALRRALEQASPSLRQRLQQMPGHWLAEAARLLPELRPQQNSAADDTPGPLDGPGAQSRFYEAICRVLLALSSPPGASAPGIFFLDDAHWADDDSLELLAFLVKRLASHPLLVVVAWRLEATPAAQRLPALLTAARRNGQATHIPLQRLTSGEVQELFDRLQQQGDNFAPSWRDALYAETEGLPFFIAEYLQAALDGAEPDLSPAPAGETPDIAPLPGGWRIPPAVRDLLRARLSGLDEIAWQLLNCAAVIGRSFHFDTCRLASGRSEEEAVEALEQLVARGIIAEVRSAGHAAAGPLYDFSHNQIRALVYDETSLARRRLLHRRVAEALLQQTRNEAQWAQVAQHYLLAGQEATAADYFWRAGEHARGLYANAAALAHLRAALALGHPRTADIHEAIGDLHTLLGDYDRAIAAYEAAAAHTAADAHAHLEHKLGNVHARAGHWLQAETHFQAALALANGYAGREPAVGALYARLYADWSLVAHRQGRRQQAQQLAHSARDLARQNDDDSALAQAYNILGILARHAGELQEAQQQLEQSLALAAGRPSARIAALNNLALVYSLAQQPNVALQTLEEALALCQTLGDRHREAALLNNLADLHHAAGRTAEAMAHLKRAAAIFIEVGGDAEAWQPEIWKLSEW